MAIEVPPQGSVIEYPYLWLNQSLAGEIEGRKERPVCLALRVKHGADEVHHLLLLAITSKSPSVDQRAIEIPETERRRTGLTRYPAAWIIVSEYNYDIAERSFYYDPSGAVLGVFSSKFMATVAQALRDQLRLGRGRVNRSS